MAPPWLTELVRQSPDALVTFGPDGVLLYANPAAVELMGIDPQRLGDHNAFDFVHAEDLARAGAAVTSVTDGARPLPGLIRIRRTDGTFDLFEVGANPLLIPTPDGSVTEVLSVVIRDNTHHDVHWNFLTALTRGEPFHTCLEVLAAGLTNEADGPLVIAYDEGTRRRAAGSLPALLAGVTDGEEVDRTPGTPWAEALRTGRPVCTPLDQLPGPVRLAAREIGSAACVVVPVPDPGSAWPVLLVQWPGRASMVGILSESLVRRPLQVVTIALERRDAIRRLEHLALHDSLTGLVNRFRFFDVLAGLERARGTYGVCYVDLDRFKPINDTLGHLVGDDVIVAAARRLEEVARADDVVARLGGDEFALACPGVNGPGIEAVAQRIVEAMKVPVEVSGHTLDVGASVGCALARPGETADVVVGAADAALYEAKRAGRGTWRSATPLQT